MEIIVEASIEPALKEIKRLMPEIKKQVTQAVEVARKSMEQIDMKSVSNKIQKAIQFVKKKIDDLKKSSQNNEIKIKVNNKEAERQISQLEKEIESLQKKISERQIKLDFINPQIDKMVADTRNEVTPDGISKNDKSMDSMVNNVLASNRDFTSLNSQAQKLYTEIEIYNKQLSEAKTKMSQLKQETKQTATTQNKLSGFFSVFKDKISKLDFTKVVEAFSRIPKITTKINNYIKKMGTGLKGGLRHVLKYAGALFSLRTIYSTISSLATNWLSSQNTEAKQASANIEYMKNVLSSMLAPAIQFITNLTHQLLKAIQSLVYAFSGINIFAKATASSMSSTANSANKASKSLGGVHSEINNVSENNSGGSGGTTSPSIDLSQVDTQMSSLSQKLYNFFVPLKESWDTYGSKLIEQIKTTVSQITGLISGVWQSFENIITNGTVYSILENILSIIGSIAEAFSNAWNNSGNGDKIIQNLADAFNSLLTAINDVTKSKGSQEFLKNCSEKFKIISEKISEIDWQPLVDALTSIGENVGSLALDILSGLVSIFKWLAENPVIAEIIIAIALAISLVSTVLGILGTVMGILTPIATAFGVSMSALILPILGIVVAIAAIIAIIVLCITYWEEIKTVVMNVVNAVVEFVTNLWDKVSFIFEAIWDVISTILGFIWDMFSTVFEAIWGIVSPIINAIWTIISTVFQTIWTIISTILTSVWDIFSQIFNWIWQLVSKVFQGIWNIISPIITKVWETIKNVLGKIKEVWNNIWNGIKTTVVNIWNGIWGAIKSVINSILGGIESFVNGVIKGINKILSGISSVANAVGSLIGLDPINLQLSTISLPRLAKGNVAYSETVAIFGEYAGASSNPEITTPQNVMAETFRDVLSDYEFNNSKSNGEIKQIVFQFGSYRVAVEMEKLLQQARRQNGTATVAV